MFGSEILDVAIGLTLVYLLLGSIVSMAAEAVSRFFAMRARNLQDGLRSLLAEDDDAAAGNLWNAAPGTELRALAASVYAHPLVRGLGKARSRLRRSTFGPSYIPSRDFALALFDTVAEAGAGGDPRASRGFDAQSALDDFDRGLEDLRGQNEAAYRALSALSRSARAAARTAEEGVARTREELEAWFNSGMERVAGWYRRKLQLIVFLLALVTVVALNVDTFVVGSSLWTDTALRRASVAAAEAAAPPGGSPAIADPLEELQSLGLPMGWGNGAEDLRWEALTLLAKLGGLLVTAVAVSLGAPFWFDALSRLLNIRASGARPAAPAAPGGVPAGVLASSAPPGARPGGIT